MRELEHGLGLAELLSSCLPDELDPSSMTHNHANMIRARMFAIAYGHEDCDNLDSLRFDPAFKLARGRASESGDDLLSQLTLSRLEDLPLWHELARMGLGLIDLSYDSFNAVPARIVLDIDDTADRGHGGQQLALFSVHYDDYCFQPIHIYDAASGKPVLLLLRPGKRASGAEAALIPRHVRSAVSGATGHGWRSPCAAMAITAPPRSWTCWKRKAAATSSVCPAMRG